MKFISTLSGLDLLLGKSGIALAHMGRDRRGGGQWLILRLFAFLLLLGSASLAHAGTVFCSQYPVVGGFHVIDGNDPSLNVLTLPSSIGIDANCYFKNFPISGKWPQGLTSTI